MLTRLIAYARGLARRRAIESEIDDELAFHLQQETEANVARGMTPDAARREALIGIGGLAQTAAAAREVRRTSADAIGRDLRHALRSLRATPAFTTVALAVLTLSIGATTAIYSVVDGVLLRDLPLPGSDRLVAVGERHLKEAGENDLNLVAPQNFTRLAHATGRLHRAGGDRLRQHQRPSRAGPRAGDARDTGGHGGVLPGARRRAARRPRVQQRERSRRECPRRGDQSSALAAAVRRRGRRRRASPPRPARGLRDSRRHAAIVRLPGRRHSTDRGLDSQRVPAGGSRPRKRVFGTVCRSSAGCAMVCRSSRRRREWIRSPPG